MLIAAGLTIGTGALAYLTFRRAERRRQDI